MSPKLPAPSAGPNKVRAYIARVLISKHDTSSDLADEIASLWRLGRGSELRDASVQVFKGIFGDFNGWLLYRIVHEDELEDWQQSIVGIISFYTMISAIILAAFLVLRALIQYAFNMPSQKGFKKVTPLIFQSCLFAGLSIITYGILTPGSNGAPIALCGFVLAFSSAAAVVVGLISPTAAGQGGGKNVLAGSG